MHLKKTILAKAHEEVLQSVLHVDEGRIMLMWDQDDNVQIVTESIHLYFDFTVEDVVNNSWEIIFPQFVIQRIKHHFKNSSKPLHIPHEVFITKNNKRLQFSITIKQTIVNKATMYVCSLQDVSETYYLKNELKRLEKLVLSAQMSANVVHEIRNPLTAIKGFLQLIQAGVEHKEEYVQVLLQEVEKIEGLTNELLQLANPNKDKKELVNVKRLINDVLLLMKAQTTLKDIDFEVSGNLDVAIYCNPNEIKQVLINLIYNGADAMGSRGTIKIRVRELRDSLVIEVIDHGHGMSEQIIEKVSNEFYTTKEDGTGLGLVVTEQIIKKHNGQLSIFSLENVGSTFEVKLPI